jgi:5-formyltetrahydrofolate cyclo-ligase
VTVNELPSHRLKQAKRAQRRRILEVRDAIDPSERAERSARIASRLGSLPEVARAATVMAFWSFGSEVHTEPLIRTLHEAGTRVALPRIEGRDIVAITYAPGDPVVPTGFGAMEPTAGEVVEPGEVDLVIVPGVAFDRSGGRVGYGGGFYDRFLLRTPPDATAIAIVFADQIVETVPAGAADRAVDAIVTEDEVIRCRTG